MRYSKSEVDRAGRLFADQLRKGEGRRRIGEQSEDIEQAVKVIEWWRHGHAGPLSRTAANLRYYAAEEGTPRVAQRLKKLPTIAGKLVREPAMKLSRMADIGGVRAVLPDQDSAYRVAASLRKNWTIVRFRDYVTEPKADGYRALHLINRNRGRLIEVQLRTPRQDNWANLAETLSRLGAPNLKYGSGPPEIQEFLLVSSERAALEERGLPVKASMMKRYWDLLSQTDSFVDRASDES